jgi:hypothetical protein
MAQDLTVNIKTTSDVPQAMNKASTAVSGFDKQLGDIGNKFKTSFKDIFLGFAAPMVILQSAISLIQESIAKAKQDAKEGLDLIAKGETAFASTEEKKMAAFFKAKKEREEEKKLVEAGKAEMAAQFMKTDQGKAIADKMAAERVSKLGPGAQIDIGALSESLKGDKEFQQAALEAFLNSEEGKAFKPMFENEAASQQKAGTFKGPEGFGTVIGVGANPVMEKMTRQNELLEEIRMILEQQYIDNRGGTVPDPFTERVNAPTLKAGLA